MIVRVRHGKTTHDRAISFIRFNVAWAAPVLAGCAGPLSTLDPAGPAAAATATLWWTMLAGATLLFVLVGVLLLYAFLKPGAGARASPRIWLAGGGLVLPALVLTPLLIYALWVGESLLAHHRADPVRVDVVARQWGWTFTYPDAPGGPRTSLNVLHVPVERSIDLHVTSADVIHSFWVPRLAGKIDAIPGHTTVLRLSAAQPGIYRGVCAEFCGTGHAAMDFAVEAHPQAGYAERIGSLSPAVEPRERTP